MREGRIGFRVNEEIERPSAELIERLKKFSALRGVSGKNPPPARKSSRG